jgi:retinol dehydrogenase-12
MVHELFFLQGASTTCHVALSPQMEGVSGRYLADCNESNCSSLANDESEAQNLFKRTCALIYKRLGQPPKDVSSFVNIES